MWMRWTSIWWVWVLTRSMVPLASAPYTFAARYCLQFVSFWDMNVSWCSYFLLLWVFSGSKCDIMIAARASGACAERRRSRAWHPFRHCPDRTNSLSWRSCHGLASHLFSNFLTFLWYLSFHSILISHIQILLRIVKHCLQSFRFHPFSSLFLPIYLQLFPFNTF